MDKSSLGIVIPVFNDWASASELLKNLSQSMLSYKEFFDIEIVFVDDGSTEMIPSISDLSKYGLVVSVLPLASNVGHQNAIITGLRYVRDIGFSYVLVMDSDGEDTIQGVTDLIKASLLQPDKVIVAQRGIRSEKLSFRIMYRAHKALFHTLIGKNLDFGNFCLLPKNALAKILSLADSSSHLPSSILRSGLPLFRVRVDRGARYFGETKMSFEKLVAHSFASLAVFSDSIMVRLMIFSSFSILVAGMSIGAVIFTRLFSASTTPGWATAAVGLLLVLSLQILSFVGLGTLITLNLNSLKNFFRTQSGTNEKVTTIKSKQVNNLNQ
jgi:polyisoprenyl-phosphate glycosyltransferase